MKIRKGFVSNSSSSSFILGIDLDCKTFEDFIATLYFWMIPYGNLDSEDGWCDTAGIKKTHRECLEILWEDIKDRKTTMNEWKKYTSRMSTSMDDYVFLDTYCVPNNISNEWEGKESEKIQKRLEKIGDEWNGIIYEALSRGMKERYEDNIFSISYSDNDGPLMSLMEHGDFWNLIPHVRINNH